MTLTAVVGSSGSGKTTFLNDVHKSHKCTYIRQYHSIRPFVSVVKIPNFDPTSLPYWDIYEREGTTNEIKVGGTMAGEFTAGLSGGQRKLLLFELIYQRTKNQSKLLIVLDEPFSGVTDDFVPWITSRLEEMSKKHNILLVTNDHVESITTLADNTITVSAIDRTRVTINGNRQVDREKAIMALSLGDEYVYKSTGADLQFFFDVEVANNGGLIGVAGFTVFAFLLFLLSFWGSDEDSGALVLVAGGIIAYFAVNPYLLSLVDWRNYMSEEAEALLHSSKSLNKMMKTLLTMFLILIISFVEYFCIIAVIDGFSTFDFWVAIFFDSGSMTFPFLCFGLYTAYSHQLVETLASMPFLFMIFFSTTFSPGSGVAGLKELRYLFSRFYFWCMIPGIQDQMDNCPDDPTLNMVYLVLSGLLGVVLFLVAMGINGIIRASKHKKADSLKEKLQDDEEFIGLQIELYGEKGLRRLQRRDSLGDTSHSSISGVAETTKPSQLEESTDDKLMVDVEV